MASHTKRHRSDAQANNGHTTLAPTGSNNALEGFKKHTQRVKVGNTRLRLELAEVENGLLIYRGRIVKEHGEYFWQLSN